MREIDVAVGVIFNADQQILLTRRRADVHQGGLWEFPGGKCEASETVAEALDRELQEELAIAVTDVQPLLELSHDYGDKRVRLHVYSVTGFNGEPEPREGQPMRWVCIDELGDYAFPAANAPIVECLQLRDLPR
ncbi:MAG: hypothetical protein Cons2KO_23650 [Congregibacter sp.]